MSSSARSIASASCWNLGDTYRSPPVRMTCGSPRFSFCIKLISTVTGSSTARLTGTSVLADHRRRGHLVRTEDRLRIRLLEVGLPLVLEVFLAPTPRPAIEPGTGGSTSTSPGSVTGGLPGGVHPPGGTPGCVGVPDVPTGGADGPPTPGAGTGPAPGPRPPPEPGPPPFVFGKNS